MFSFELMKTIAIFALITLVACDTINPVCHNQVTVSPANPVQFWPVDCQTYNEKEVCGIYSRCYCQPFNCSDEIKTQITDDQGDDFSIVIEDELGGEIDEIELVQEEDASGNLFPSYLDFENTGSGTDWTIDETPAVSLNGISSSKNMDASRTLSAGKYRLDYTISFSSSMVLSIFFIKDGVEVESQSLIPFFGSSPITDSIDIVLSESVDGIRFRASRTAPGSGSVNLGEFTLVLLTYTYSASFVPDDLGICDEKILLRIYNTTASPRVEEYRSDCLDIRTEHQCTNLIEYSNNRNYTGLIYTNISPEPSFQIRIRSIFFHEEFPQEDFVMELTSGIEKTSGVITAQRRFDVDRVPYYMHKKLILIFEHQSILIDGAYWTKQEKYEMIDNQKQTFPMKKGQVLLTMRDFVQRSVL